MNYVEIKNRDGEVYNYEIVLRNLVTKQVFSIYLNDYEEVVNYLKKRKYSKKVKALYVMNDMGYTFDEYC